MTHTPTIEIHGQRPDGTTYVLNHLTKENANVSCATGPARETALARLRQHALDCVGRWQALVPDDVVKGVEL